MAEVENTSSVTRKCVGCGAELVGSTTRELCPKCLLKLAMETQPGTVVLPGTGPSSRGLPQPGEQFGHYAIIRLLGAGGMGAVYEAQELETERRVALKVLSHTLDTPNARERFFREGRLAASINHPNSVYIFGTEEIGGTPVIAMELVSGGTLQARVRDRGALPVGEAVDCVLQIIEGLEAAQHIGILHRDIKPSNCFIGEDGVVKVGDFGLSISTAVRTEPALTATGAFLGTPAFCSPEQLRGEELNTRSDMYSVGATLFNLLTGRTPFEGENLVQMLSTVLEQRAPSPRQFRPEIPQGLAKVVLRCLEKLPGERYRSYADLSQALAPYSTAAPTPATFGLRFVAGMVDSGILYALSFVINVSVFGGPIAFLLQSMEVPPKMLACVVGWVAVALLYFALFEGRWGAAVGKALCGLRVVGPDRNPPGFTRAWLRGLVYVLPPLVPYWGFYGRNPKAYLSASPWTQMLLGCGWFAIMGLLFVTARRRNGFAAVQDLLTRTRVISRAAFNLRPVPGASEGPPTAIECAVTIGPYHVLQELTESVGGKWVLAYDLKLLRKVWIRVVPEGTPPVPARWRSLGRVGRLRWLTGKRSSEENWDAFEALTGRPLLEVSKNAQPWGEVRFWLHDLAVEIQSAEKDGTLPELGLDRVWLTGEGRIKLLDFPAPGLRSPKGPTDSGPDSQTQNAPRFLAEVAAAALAGTGPPGKKAAAEVPLPLHARVFLKGLCQLPGAQAIAAALRPLMHRAAAVSRLRRGALVAGCMAVPLLAFGGGFLSLSMLHEVDRTNPGLMDLSGLLQLRTSGRFRGGKEAQVPTDRQLAIYIVHHYRGMLTNQATWSNPFVLSLMNGERRAFVEKSLAQYPAPTEAELADADAVVGQFLPKLDFFAVNPPLRLATMLMVGALLACVCLPALIAALAFRGGLVLLIAGVTFVRKDGRRASRMRFFWRALLAWCPSFCACLYSMQALDKQWSWGPWVALALTGLLAAWSVALPGRGLQDRLAGTWPVPP